MLVICCETKSSRCDDLTKFKLSLCCSLISLRMNAKCTSLITISVTSFDKSCKSQQVRVSCSRGDLGILAGFIQLTHLLIDRLMVAALEWRGGYPCVFWSSTSHHRMHASCSPKLQNQSDADWGNDTDSPHLSLSREVHAEFERHYCGMGNVQKYCGRLCNNQVSTGEKSLKRINWIWWMVSGCACTGWGAALLWGRTQISHDGKISNFSQKTTTTTQASVKFYLTLWSILLRSISK